MKKHFLLILLLVLVAGEAIYDGLKDKGSKEESKYEKIVWLACWFICWKWFEFQNIFFYIYMDIRLLSFDYIRKYVSGGKVCGTTSFYDRHICKIVHNPHMMILLLFILVVLIVNYYELINVSRIR